jgi:hypothetical protein
MNTCNVTTSVPNPLIESVQVQQLLGAEFLQQHLFVGLLIGIYARMMLPTNA